MAAKGGIVDFTVEPTGRYGGISVHGQDQIQVTCRAIADVVDGVLACERAIDLLKVDTEGAELETIRALSPLHLARIRTICFETRHPHNPGPAHFAMHFACQTCRLDQRRVSSAR